MPSLAVGVAEPSILECALDAIPVESGSWIDLVASDVPVPDDSRYWTRFRFLPEPILHGSISSSWNHRFDSG